MRRLLQHVVRVQVVKNIGVPVLKMNVPRLNKNVLSNWLHEMQLMPSGQNVNLNLKKRLSKNSSNYAPKPKNFR